ncbi:MAG: S41 family peptidase [Peptococcaceae bacterium]|nr:S41 family peptidase [Peptococcaceae bacterium]
MLLTGVAAAVVGAAIIFGLAVVTNYKQVGNLVKVIHLIETQYVKEVPTSRLIEGALDGIVNSLDDPYSVYLEPETFKRFKEQMRGSFGGLGILVGIRGENQLTVVRPFEGTPADRAGLREGDVIVEIDGIETKNIDLETAVALMRGPVGTEVKLKVKRENNEDLLDFCITREEIQIPTVESRMLDDSIGYILLTQFAENTVIEFEQALEELKDRGMKALILDLRNNPGGNLSTAVRIADQFLAKGPIVKIDYRQGEDQTYPADKKALDMPLVVLVNEGSASASEIVAGAVKDSRVGTLVGEKTFGKGVVQTVFELDNGAGLKLTTARYLTPSGYDLNKKGIEPDILVPLPDDAGQDLQLQKAVELLQEKLG